jgi:hypothetical protein
LGGGVLGRRGWFVIGGGFGPGGVGRRELNGGLLLCGLGDDLLGREGEAGGFGCVRIGGPWLLGGVWQLEFWRVGRSRSGIGLWRG